MAILLRGDAMRQINFLTPEEYFWGVRSELALQAEQCGVYNRCAFALVRRWLAPPVADGLCGDVPPG